MIEKEDMVPGTLIGHNDVPSDSSNECGIILEDSTIPSWIKIYWISGRNAGTTHSYPKRIIAEACALLSSSNILEREENK